MVLLVGEDNAFTSRVSRNLDVIKTPWMRVAPQDVPDLKDERIRGVGSIALTALDSKTQLAVARSLVRNTATARIPLKYIALPHLENAPFNDWDTNDSIDFISPLLVAFGKAPFLIYAESLTRFRPKTAIRDFLDLCQLLHSVETRGVNGNVAEFGSYQGHSGYLISRMLDEMGSKKTLFMFDTFDRFPEEPIGIDRSWSGTHVVDFRTVTEKFRDRSGVKIIKGDFIQTLPVTQTGPLSLCFIDCDSYRATRFLLNYLWERRLTEGGILVLEDYGHATLLGNRAAIHEFFDDRRDAITYFSQFSGSYIAVKESSLEAKNQSD